MDYRIDVNESLHERVYACVDVYRYRHFIVSIEREAKGIFYVSFRLSDYLSSKMPDDATKLAPSLVRYSLVKRLTDVTDKEITEVLKKFPRPLLEVAFSRVIPELYVENKRVKSDKYKRLVLNYGHSESVYLASVGKAETVSLSDWGLDD